MRENKWYVHESMRLVAGSSQQGFTDLISPIAGMLGAWVVLCCCRIIGITRSDSYR